MTEQPRTEGSTGDVDFDALYRSQHRAVLAYCARRASRADAWDAASDVFLVAWRRLDDVPPGEEATAWLLGIAYRVLANQRRSASRSRRLFRRMAATDSIVSSLADEPIIRNEEEAEVIASLSRLRDADKEILQLSLWEELNPEEIAGILGISRNAVDQRYLRAKKRLSREMDRKSTIKGRATHMTSRKGGGA